MKNVVSKLAFLLCLLLVFTSVMPVQAATDEWSKYTYKYGRGLSEPVSTSTGELLIEDVDNDEGNAVYNYDIAKLNKQGLKEKKSLNGGLNKFIQYEGKTYIFFYNHKIQNLEIYDENFTLLDTEKLGLTGSRIAINQVSNYVRYEVSKWNGYSQGWVKESKIYDLEKQQLVSEVSLPASRAEKEDNSNGNESINLYDDLGQIVKSISLDHLNVEGSYISHDIYLWRDQITFIESVYDSDYNSSLSIKTISMDGQLLKNQPLKNKLIDFWQSTQKDGVLYLVGEVNVNGDSKQTGMEYNLETFEFKDNQPISDIFSVIPINDNFYGQRQEVGDLPSSLIIKNKEHKTLYTLENTVFGKALNTYMFVYVYDPITYADTHQIIEIATGKVMKTSSSDTHFQFVSDNRLYVTEFNESNTAPYETITTGQLVILGDVPAPTDTYEPNKPWTITFNADVDATTVDSTTVYVMDSNGTKAHVSTSVQGNKIFVTAPQSGYTSGETYTLHVKQSIKSAVGVTLKDGRTKIFTIK